MTRDKLMDLASSIYKQGGLYGFGGAMCKARGRQRAKGPQIRERRGRRRGSHSGPVGFMGVRPRCLSCSLHLLQLHCLREWGGDRRRRSARQRNMQRNMQRNGQQAIATIPDACSDECSHTYIHTSWIHRYKVNQEMLQKPWPNGGTPSRAPHFRYERSNGDRPAQVPVFLTASPEHQTRNSRSEDSMPRESQRSLDILLCTHFTPSCTR